MITLISKDEKEHLHLSLNLSACYTLEYGDMLIVTKEMDMISKWLQDKGVSHIHFDPNGDFIPYEDYMISDDNTIRLYNLE